MMVDNSVLTLDTVNFGVWTHNTFDAQTQSLIVFMIIILNNFLTNSSCLIFPESFTDFSFRNFFTAMLFFARFSWYLFVCCINPAKIVLLLSSLHTLPYVFLEFGHFYQYLQFYHQLPPTTIINISTITITSTTMMTNANTIITHPLYNHLGSFLQCLHTPSHCTVFPIVICNSQCFSVCQNPAMIDSTILQDILRTNVWSTGRTCHLCPVVGQVLCCTAVES